MYKIQLPNFEGPYDLLLYFLRRDEINIYDIPIAKITDEFLHYIRLMKLFDLELAGEFIVTAATLMYIKAQMLVPKDENAQDENIEDPRAQLVKNLLEYNRIKEVSGELNEIYEENKYNYYREIFSADILEYTVDNYKNATLFDLINAFQGVISRNNKVEKVHELDLIPITIEEQSANIVRILRITPRLSFRDFLLNQNRNIIVVTFLAILDLIKSRTIFINQEELFEDISISLVPNLN